LWRWQWQRGAAAVQAHVATALQARNTTSSRGCTLQARNVLLLQLALRQRYAAVAARVAATLLQLASQQRCAAHVVAAVRVVATLRSSRRDNAAQFTSLRHYYNRRYFSSRRGNGKQGYAALQRWQVASVEIFVFFFTRQFQRENESKTERKETGLRNLFPGSVGWLECNTKAPSRNNSSSNLRSFLALPPVATTPHQ